MQNTQGTECRIQNAEHTGYRMQDKGYRGTIYRIQNTGYRMQG